MLRYINRIILIIQMIIYNYLIQFNDGRQSIFLADYNNSFERQINNNDSVSVKSSFILHCNIFHSNNFEF